MDRSLHTSVDEIADQVFRLSTWVPDISEHGFTFNQFLLTGDQPFLFHCGMRQLFPLVSAAIAKVIPLEQLRWISFAHVEADECGAMNLLLAAAPHAEVIHGPLACMLSLDDLCDRPPVPVRYRRARHRRTPAAVHRHPARTAQLGKRALVRRNHLYTFGRRPAHAHRSMPRPHRIRLCGTGFRGRVVISRHRPDH